MNNTAAPQTSRRWNIAGVAVDIIMLVLITVNLALIIFDWLYGVENIQYLLSRYLPAFFAYYGPNVHERFNEIDLAFVTVYIIEFCAMWLIAIMRKRYHRWFYYPFIHWYDLLGCIPVGSFRWLRVLRVFSILVRLQQLGWIQLQNTYVGGLVIKYYKALVEEISDRVVINVLDGAQKELTMGSPLLERILDKVLAPRKQALLHLACNQIADGVKKAHTAHRNKLEAYLGQITDEVLANSTAGRQLRVLPFASRIIRQQVRQIGLALVDGIAHDVSNPDNHEKLVELLDSIIKIETEEPLTPLIQDIIYDVIEQIKAQVAIKQWRQEV